LTAPIGLSQFYGQVSASGTPEWYLTDLLGSVRQVVSPSGSVLDAITYDPYGSLYTQTNSSYEPRFGYAGGALDGLTGDYQFGSRYYSPTDGRWESEDPDGFWAGDANLYRYVFNAPTDWTDPSGLAGVRPPPPPPPTPPKGPLQIGDVGLILPLGKANWLRGVPGEPAPPAWGMEKVWIASRQIEGSWLPDFIRHPFMHCIVNVQNPDGTISTYSYIGKWVPNALNDQGYTGWWSQYYPAFGTFELPAGSVRNAYEMRKIEDEDKYELLSYNCQDAAFKLVADSFLFARMEVPPGLRHYSCKIITSEPSQPQK
jgi:RHS repeat-associated protein